MCCKDKNAGVNAVEVTVSHTSVHCVTADLLKMLTAEVNSVRGLVWMITEKNEIFLMGLRHRNLFMI